MNELDCNWIEFKYLSMLTSNDRSGGETSGRRDVVRGRFVSIRSSNGHTAQDNDSFDTGTQENASLSIMAIARHVSRNGLDWSDLVGESVHLLSAGEKHVSVSTMIAIDGKRRRMNALLR